MNSSTYQWLRNHYPTCNRDTHKVIGPLRHWLTKVLQRHPDEAHEVAQVFGVGPVTLYRAALGLPILAKYAVAIASAEDELRALDPGSKKRLP